MKLVAVSWIVLATACSSSAKQPAGAAGPSAPGVGAGSDSAGSDSAGSDGAGSDGAATACKVDGDCVVVETACCDHCNGGKAMAFNKAAADAHRPTGCEATMCTEMACGKAIAACASGVCTVTIGKAF